MDDQNLWQQRASGINRLIQLIGGTGSGYFSYEGRDSRFEAFGSRLLFVAPFETPGAWYRLDRYRNLKGFYTADGDYVAEGHNRIYRVLTEKSQVIPRIWRSIHLLYLCLDFTDYIITGMPTYYNYSRGVKWGDFWKSYSSQELKIFMQTTVDIGFFEDKRYSDQQLHYMESEGIDPGLSTPFGEWDPEW